MRDGGNLNADYTVGYADNGGSSLSVYTSGNATNYDGELTTLSQSLIVAQQDDGRTELANSMVYLLFILQEVMLRKTSFHNL